MQMPRLTDMTSVHTEYVQFERFNLQIVTFHTHINPRTYKRSHTPHVVQGELAVPLGILFAIFRKYSSPAVETL